jgi:hypothetical protein
MARQLLGGLFGVGERTAVYEAAFYSTFASVTLTGFAVDEDGDSPTFTRRPLLARMRHCPHASAGLNAGESGHTVAAKPSLTQLKPCVHDFQCCSVPSLSE